MRRASHSLHPGLIAVTVAGIVLTSIMAGYFYVGMATPFSPFSQGSTAKQSQTSAVTSSLSGGESGTSTVVSLATGPGATVSNGTAQGNSSTAESSAYSSSNMTSSLSAGSGAPIVQSCADYGWSTPSSRASFPGTSQRVTFWSWNR